ncbi:hypothetical protein Sme01_27830 [Sphaerisporangium melleum]|uniref:Cation/H+ exchanger transmembrane domain-containing protein n=1 Tax=Sphaerisporangium melleum TaxID=321316 RepID=A0A917VFF6_9ACTN|nr:hypothetical protein GCM10007964_11520 [Sphaerisporangium melleum]GII70307.1 hypothetical protein Sme01_27830 [Sphaerisporangium melleum]
MTPLSADAVESDHASPAAAVRRRRIALSYLLTAVLPALLALGLLVALAMSSARAPAAGPAAGGPADHTVRLFVAIAVVILAARLFGGLARRVGQPPVVGEIFAGLCLGPSVLGAVFPAAGDWLFPIEIRPVLQGLADIGLIALMFVVGQESRRTPLKGHGGTAMSIAQAGIAGPFLGGALLAVLLYPAWAGPRADPVVFAMFLGSALSITAFPVLARILDEKGMTRTRVGRLSMLCAAIADVVAWCMIAAMAAVAGQDSPARAALTVVLVVAYGAFMAGPGRRLLARLFAAIEGYGEGARLLALIVGLLLSSAVTSAIGIHAIFGAFIFGFCCPPAVIARQAERINALSGALLLPFFFVGTGLRTDVWRDGLSAALIGVTLLVTAVALAGKLAGPMLMARSSGLSWADSGTLGVLLNARGLTELVLLNLGLSLGLLSDRLFVALVLMALATTAMTAPLLRLAGVIAARADRRGT